MKKANWFQTALTLLPILAAIIGAWMYSNERIVHVENRAAANAEYIVHNRNLTAALKSELDSSIVERNTALKNEVFSELRAVRSQMAMQDRAQNEKLDMIYKFLKENSNAKD